MRIVKERIRNTWYSPINPNRPRILPKTSTTRILTNKFGSAASARAAVEPVIPTQIPQSKLHAPTVIPPQKTAKPNGGEVRKMTVVEAWLRRACKVVVASVHSGIRDRGQFGRVDDTNNLVRHSEGIVGVENILATHNAVNCHNFTEDDTVRA